MTRHGIGIPALLTGLLILLTLAFIWGNSLLPNAQSHELSDRVAGAVEGGTTTPGGNSSGGAPARPSIPAPAGASQMSFPDLVRKWGHVIEFAVLGAEVLLLLVLLPLGHRERVIWLLLGGVLCPFVDETLQMLNDRNPAVYDMWLDLSGYAIGAGAMLLIAAAVWTVRGLRRRASEED